MTTTDATQEDTTRLIDTIEQAETASLEAVRKGGISAKRRKQMRPAHVALTARSLSPSSLSESERR